MGCVESTDASEESVQQRLAAKEVEKFLAKERKTEKPLKMLLLGASDSGKSTFRKQFEIINGMMSEDKRAMHKENIHGSMISWMDKATAELRPAEGTPYGIALEEFRQCRTRNRREVDPAMQAALKKLLAMNECTQALTDNINQGAIPVNVMYYYEKLDDIAKKDYRPSNEECVALRLTTIGIVELRFNVNGKLLLLVDVGGQRSERKKWFSAFDDVACILYCIALDEFDMNLAEKPDVNRMEESLSIFKDVCNRSEFAKTPFVLLFNKADLLQKKLTALADQKLTGAMQDYEGSVDYKNVLSAIQDKYLSLGDQRDADGKKRDVYPHVTTATQEACVRTVWNSLVDIFTKKNVASAFS